MVKHTLSLDIIESLNCSILRIDDTSIYTNLIPIECATLRIFYPGSSYPVDLSTNEGIIPNFRLNLTACDLGLQTENCNSNLSSLPDGIYTLNYSVSPNDKIFAEYYHLRTCNLRNCYDQILCELDLANCEPNVETEKKLKLLHEIDLYIKAAIANVEICHETDKGIQLYTYAKKLISKFTCSTCSSCS